MWPWIDTGQGAQGASLKWKGIVLWGRGSVVPVRGSVVPVRSTGQFACRNPDRQKDLLLSEGS